MLKPRYRTNQLICRIDTTPFTVVLLVVVVTLLVIEMTIPRPHHGVSVDLPKVGHPISMWQAGRSKAVMIAIHRDGKVFFGRDPVLTSDLAPRIRDSVSRGSERKAYIRADARAKYGWVSEVLDEVHAAGIEKIGILVDQRRPLSDAP